MSFLKNLFTGEKDGEFIESFLEEFFQTCGFSLSCDKVIKKDETLIIEIYGADEELLLERGGKLLQAIQSYLYAVLQNRLRELDRKDTVYIHMDSGGFLKQYETDLMNLARKLKKEALRKKRPVLIKKSINAFYRRQIHQDLTEDGTVKTQSLGEGLFKTIKIIPVQGKNVETSR